MHAARGTDVELAGRCVWRGPGRAGFLLPDEGAAAADTVPSALERVESAAKLDSLLDSMRRSRAAADSRGDPFASLSAARSLRDYFAHGGLGSTVVRVPLEPGDAAARWVGSDAGPGERSGLHTFLDDEDLTSVVVPALGGPLVDAVLGFVRRHPRVYFFLEEASGETSGRGEPPLGLRLVAENAVLVGFPSPLGWSPGGVLGHLESQDVSPGDAGTSSRPRCGSVGGVRLAPGAREALAAIATWRRWAGLNRSLDAGSRWVLLESLDPLLAGRVEREVRSFLYALSRDGVVAPPRVEDRPVSCTLSPVGEASPGDVSLSLAVRARIVPSLPGRSGGGSQESTS